MNYIQLGQRIRETRRLLKVTQVEMAEKLNFSQQHIGNIERGSAHPSLDLLVDISNTLNVSVDYLLQDSLQRPCTETASEICSDIQHLLKQQQYEIIRLQKIYRNTNSSNTTSQNNE